MSLNEAIYAWWQANGTLCALAGSRLYPQKLPQGSTLPASVYQQVSEVGDMAHDGPLDLFKPVYQFDCYGNSLSQAKTLALTLRQQLNGYKGTVGGVTIEGVFFVNMVDDFGDALEVYRVSVDFRFMYKE